MKVKGKVIFVAGIDTDAGKSYATGWLAKELMDRGKSVVTQKFVQTGNEEWSEDIDVHRRIMGTGMLDVDKEHITAPLIFSYPCSAQLAARIDGREIDLGLVDESSRILAERFDTVLVEGAGGLMVPLQDDFLTIDYIKSKDLPVILVTNSKLGSISHTVLALEALKVRGIKLEAVLFNTYFNGEDKIIADDTRSWIERYVKREFDGVEIIDVPTIELC